MMSFILRNVLASVLAIVLFTIVITYVPLLMDKINLIASNIPV